MIPVIAVIEIVKEWKVLRPFHRWKLAREAKPENQVSENVPVEAAPAAEDEGMFADLLKSYARSALKVTGTAIATAAVTHGMFDPNSTDLVVGALETIGGGLLTLGGLWWSHRTHKAA